MALRELAIALGIDVDAKQLDAAEKRLKEFARSAQAAQGIAGAGAGAGSLSVDTEGFASLPGILKAAKGALLGFFAAMGVGAIKDFLEGMAQEGAHLDDLSQRLGVSTDEIQRWQYAAKLSGVEVEAADTSLKKFQVTLGHAATGNEEAQKAFAALKVQIKNADGTLRPITDVAADVAENVSTLGDEAKMAARLVDVFGKQGGALVPLMKNGAKGVHELYSEFERLGGGLDHDFIKAAAAADDEIDRMSFATKALKSRIAVELLPWFTKWIQNSEANTVAMAKFLRSTHALRTGLIALGTGGILGGALLLKNKWIPQALEAAKASETLSKAISFFGGGTGGFLKLAATAGVAALAVLGLYLVFDDLYALMNGGQSVIGGVWEEMHGAGSAKELVEGLNAAVDAVKQAFSDLKPAAGDALGAMIESLPVVVTLVMGLTKSILAGVTALSAWAVASDATVRGLYALAKGNGEEFNKQQTRARDAVDRAGQTIFGNERSIRNEQTGEVTRQSVGGLFGLTPRELADAQGRGSLPVGAIGPPRSDNVTINQDAKVTINVDGSKDPKVTAQEVSEHVTNEITRKQLQEAAYATPGIARAADRAGTSSRR